MPAKVAVAGGGAIPAGLGKDHSFTSHTASKLPPGAVAVRRNPCCRPTATSVHAWCHRLEGRPMQCRVCDTPYMTAPGVGPYCPDLECDSHVGKDERDLETIDRFEVQRRQRDGKVFAGMPNAALLRLKVLCLADCKRTEAIWRVVKG